MKIKTPLIIEIIIIFVIIVRLMLIEWFKKQWEYWKNYWHKLDNE